MNLDAFTLSALVDEFMDVLVGGRVQDSLDVDETGLGLEIYNDHKRQYLYLSADHHTPRVHLVDDKLRRGLTKPTQLGLMFRRYVEGGKIAHISQPSWERVLQIDVDGPEGEVTIVIEPMERRSNLLLLQGDVILDCMRRVGPDENRYRVSLPAQPYIPPPPQMGKVEAMSVNAETLAEILAKGDDPKRKAHQALTSSLFGVSPLLSKEIVYRASGDANQKATDANPLRILESMQEIVTPLMQREWKPGIAETEDSISAFSVYPLKSIPGWHGVSTTSAALSAFYGAPTGTEAYEAGKTPLRDSLKEARAKMSAKLASLQRSMTDDSEREVLRQSGELILAYQYGIAKGQNELRAQYEMDAPELLIKLDSALSPLENAQHYFERYNKAKRALDDVPKLIKETKTELAYLSQLENDLDLAVNWPEIDEVQQVLQSKGYWRGKTVKRMSGSGQSAPMRLTKDGFIMWVGRNSRQNEIVTFDKGQGLDLWLHARDVPGAHVVIRFDGRLIPDSLIEQAASIAAYYSARRNDGKVPVDVTQCKYVSKIKGAAQGMVTYRNETTRTVTPRDKDVLEG